MASTNARRLRSASTDAERRLWEKLRRRQLDGWRFRRQVPLGNYVVDFACFENRVIIEVDGGQHNAVADADAVRTNWLESQNFRIIRFWNNDVLANVDGVLEVIRAALRADP